MRILHTADWHLGQIFYQYDRIYEQEQFLIWLIKTIQSENIEVLLVSGDVFDVSNPSAAAIKLFYTFLNNAVKAQPDLQIIITAGNHDSATRLESPKPLLESSNIRISGIITKTENGNIDYEKLLVPIKNKEGVIKFWCMAIPYLRIGDYPLIPESKNPYVEGITALYNDVFQLANAKKTPEMNIISMGHLHAMNVSVDENETHDRAIMGGVECIDPNTFHTEISYTALGHIHKAQMVGGRENVRYCGSPIPLSFSELNYHHQVIMLAYENNELIKIEPISVPISIPLVRIPKTPSKLPDVITALLAIEETGEKDINKAPYLEIKLLLDGPEPSFRHQIEEALKGKYVRLVRIEASTSKESGPNMASMSDFRKEVDPEVILKKIFTRKYNEEIPGDLLNLFKEVTNELESN